MIVLGKAKSIYDLKNRLSSYKKPQREEVKILLIDDDPFPALDRLQRNNFRIRQINDVEDVSAVNDYEIVLVDIDGVGVSLSQKYQGAFLIKEIRKKYPHKIIIAYSSKTFDASYNEYFRKADFIFMKDLTTEQWVENLDEAINKAIDPIYQWIKLRNYLLDEEVRLDAVMVIEDNYVKSLNTENNDFPNKKILSKISPDIRVVLQNFAASLLFRLIIGV